MQTVLGVALACVASFGFNAGIALQALEARDAPPELGLSPVLLVRLLRRPRWFVGWILGLLAFPLQTVALLFAPVTAVQPADAAGLLLLLFLGARKLGERVGRPELLATAAIVAGIAGLTLASPHREVTHVATGHVLIPLGAVLLLALVPYLLRRVVGPDSRIVVLGAGFAFALGAFCAKLLADAITRGAWHAAALVLVVAAASASLGTLSEQSALQRRQATQVAPIIFVVELLVPIFLAVTVVNEDWSKSPAWIGLSLALVTAGTIALGRAPTIAEIYAADASRESASHPQPAPLP